jgi:hypothetical protein
MTTRAQEIRNGHTLGMVLAMLAVMLVVFAIIQRKRGYGREESFAIYFAPHAITLAGMAIACFIWA